MNLASVFSSTGQFPVWIDSGTSLIPLLPALAQGQRPMLHAYQLWLSPYLLLLHSLPDEQRLALEHADPIWPIKRTA